MCQPFNLDEVDDFGFYDDAVALTFLPLGYLSLNMDADVDVKAVHEFLVAGFPDSDVPVVALLLAEVNDDFPVVVSSLGGEFAGTFDDLPRFLNVNCHFAAPRKRDRDLCGPSLVRVFP